jgi:hypothetical protein
MLTSTDLGFAEYNVRVTVLRLEHVGGCNDEQKLPAVEVWSGILERVNVHSLAAGE